MYGGGIGVYVERRHKSNQAVRKECVAIAAAEALHSPSTQPTQHTKQFTILCQGAAGANTVCTGGAVASFRLPPPRELTWIKAQSFGVSHTHTSSLASTNVHCMIYMLILCKGCIQRGAWRGSKSSAHFGGEGRKKIRGRSLPTVPVVRRPPGLPIAVLFVYCSCKQRQSVIFFLLA
jgi:hypothetical protein